MKKSKFCISLYDWGSCELIERFAEFDSKSDAVAYLTGIGATHTYVDGYNDDEYMTGGWLSNPKLYSIKQRKSGIKQFVSNLFGRDAVSYYVMKYNFKGARLFFDGHMEELEGAKASQFVPFDKTDWWRREHEIVGAVDVFEDAVLWLKNAGAVYHRYPLRGNYCANIYATEDAVYEIVQFKGRRRNMRILKGQLIYEGRNGIVRKNIFGAYDKKDAKSRIKRGAALAAENPKFVHNIQMLCVNPL